MKEIKAEIAEWIVFENAISLFGEEVQEKFRVIEMRKKEDEPFYEFILKEDERKEKMG